MKKKGWDTASFGPDGTALQRADDAGKRLSNNRNPLGEKMSRYEIENATGPRIAVVGVGGAGCNVVSTFYDNLAPVDTIAINTDKDALHSARADQKLYICKQVLHGEGAQGDATIGRRCADIHKEEIFEALSDYDAVFVIAGLGGGTGTGAMSVVLDAAHSQGVMTFAIAINPFSFEGSRTSVAAEAWNHIKSIYENCIRIDNDKILGLMPDLDMTQAFEKVNRSLMHYILKCTDILCNVLDDAPAGEDGSEAQHAEHCTISALMSA